MLQEVQIFNETSNKKNLFYYSFLFFYYLSYYNLFMGLLKS